MAKAPAKKKATKSTARSAIITPGAIVIPLQALDEKQMKKCLQKSGKITFAFKEISATKIPIAEIQSVDPIID